MNGRAPVSPIVRGRQTYPRLVQRRPVAPPDGKALYMAYSGQSNSWICIEKYALP